MCGIFGIIPKKSLLKKELSTLANHATQRGRDSSGIALLKGNSFRIFRSEMTVSKLLNNLDLNNLKFVMGHSRLKTTGSSELLSP